MSKKRDGSERKFLVEFIIIVVGVFVAVAAESWWSEREDRQFEREIVEDMIVEFESNIRILNADIAENVEASKRMGVLRDLSDEELLAIDDDVLIEQLGSYMLWAGFDPEMGSVQAFLESGNTGAFSDRELRLLLSRWSGLLVKNRRLNLQAVDYQHIAVGPVLAEASSDLVWSGSERREIRNLLVYLQTLQGFVVGNQRDLLAAAEDILAFLRDEE